MKSMAKRYNWIDYAKGIGIFLMVFGHSGFPIFIQKMIWAFHLPLFFFISGMMFNREKYSSLHSLINRIWRTLVIPYMFFSIIIVCGYILINFNRGFPLTDNWGGIQLLTNGWGGIALWFVSTLIITQFLFWIISGVSSKLNFHISIWTIVLLVLSYMAHIYKIELPYKIENIGLSFVFYSVGYMSKKFIFETRPRLMISIGLICITFVCAQFFDRFDICSNNFSSGIPSIALAFCGTIGTLFLCKYIEEINSFFFKNILSWGGKYLCNNGFEPNSHAAIDRIIPVDSCSRCVWVYI